MDRRLGLVASLIGVLVVPILVPTSSADLGATPAAFLATGRAYTSVGFIPYTFNLTLGWDGASTWSVDVIEPNTGVSLSHAEYAGSASVYFVHDLPPCLVHDHSHGASDLAPLLVLDMEIMESYDSCERSRFRVDANGQYLGMFFAVTGPG